MIFFLLNLKHLRYFSYAGKPLEFCKRCRIFGLFKKKLKFEEKNDEFSDRWRTQIGFSRSNVNFDGRLIGRKK